MIRFICTFLCLASLLSAYDLTLLPDMGRLSAPYLISNDGTVTANAESGALVITDTIVTEIPSHIIATNQSGLCLCRLKGAWATYSPGKGWSLIHPSLPEDIIPSWQGVLDDGTVYGCYRVTGSSEIGAIRLINNQAVLLNLGHGPWTKDIHVNNAHQAAVTYTYAPELREDFELVDLDSGDRVNPEESEHPRIALKMSDAGQIIGTAYLTEHGSRTKLFVWDVETGLQYLEAERPLDLPDDPHLWVRDVNSNGQAVGYADSLYVPGSPFACLWSREEGLVDLNAEVDSEHRLIEALAISDAGAILVKIQGGPKQYTYAVLKK